MKILYKNWKGEISERDITPIKVFFGSTTWHTDDQWLIEAIDNGKELIRTFALAGILELRVPTNELTIEAKKILNLIPMCVDKKTTTITNDMITFVKGN